MEGQSACWSHWRVLTHAPSRLPLVPPSRVLTEDAQVNRRIEYLDPTPYSRAGFTRGRSRYRGEWSPSFLYSVDFLLWVDDQRTHRI